MGRGRNSQRFQESDDESSSDESDEPQPSTSTGRGTKRPAKRNESLTEVTDGGKSSAVDDCVQCFLVLSKSKLPIKKSDLFKLVPLAKNQPQVLASAITKMKNVFGFKLVEEPDKNQFIVVNTRPLMQIGEAADDQNVADAWLMIILTIIFMQDRPIEVKRVETYMSAMDVSKDSYVTIRNKKITFKDLLTKIWVKQQYLDLEKKVENDDQVEHLKWGFRAHQEIDKMDVLKFASKLLKIPTKSFKSQYQRAMKQDAAVVSTLEEEEQSVIEEMEDE